MWPSEIRCQTAASASASTSTAESAKRSMQRDCNAQLARAGGGQGGVMNVPRITPCCRAAAGTLTQSPLLPKTSSQGCSSDCHCRSPGPGRGVRVAEGQARRRGKGESSRSGKWGLHSPPSSWTLRTWLCSLPDCFALVPLFSPTSMPWGLSKIVNPVCESCFVCWLVRWFAWLVSQSVDWSLDLGQGMDSAAA